MGETGRTVERSGLAESREIRRLEGHLKEIEQILADLIEKGGDWDSAKKQNARQQLHAHFQELGIQYFDGPKGLLSIYERVHKSYHSFPAPAGYPEPDEFAESCAKVRNKSVESRPVAPENPVATDVARYAWAEWPEVRGRGGATIENYLYNLGVMMSYPHVYEAVFGDTDVMEVDGSWMVTNGRHRSLALKTLGSDYVAKSGMNSWIKVEREQ